MTPDVPQALQPLYSTPTPNAPISLYSGALRLNASGQDFVGSGSIKYAWTPEAKIRFEIAGDPLRSIAALMRPSDPQTLEVSSGESGKCLATSASDGVQGILNGPLRVGPGGRAREILFHVTNCADIRGAPVAFGDSLLVAGRLSVEGGGWSSVIDPVSNITELRRALKDRGGYAITHVGRLRRADDAEFEISDGHQVLDCLSYLLSFAHGIWIATTLRVARDDAGRKVSEEWSNRIASPYDWHASWFSDSNPESLSELFPKFLSRWREPLWNEVIRRAVWWYVASNEHSGGLDGAVVLVQVALELLAWVVCVEDGHIISQAGFEALSAADKLRLLVNWMKVPLHIPSELPDLVQLAGAQKRKWLYGPWAFTEVRNALVHPKNRKMLEGAAGALFDVWRLGMWYLELALLHACDYRGTYTNRLRAVWAGEVENVPWQ